MFKRVVKKCPNIIILLKKDFLKEEKMTFIKNYIHENNQPDLDKYLFYRFL